MTSHHLLFGNESAQSGRAKHAIDAARSQLVDAGVRVTVIGTEPEGRTPALVARSIAEHAPDVVIALGGDGTFNEVARGILASGEPVTMGMIPMGTANDQGRSFSRGDVRGRPEGPFVFRRREVMSPAAPAAASETRFMPTTFPRPEHPRATRRGRRRRWRRR